jgi:hypothetical protein
MNAMDSVTFRLPAILGSFAALLVTFISFLAQVSPLTCLMRATTAFMVFAAFGIVIRYLLASSMQVPGGEPSEAHEGPIDEIAPGTSVGELLRSTESNQNETTA